MWLLVDVLRYRDASPHSRSIVLLQSTGRSGSSDMNHSLDGSSSQTQRDLIKQLEARNRYLSVCSSVRLSVRVCLSVFLSVRLSLSVLLPACLHVCLSVCLSVRLSVCLSVFQSVRLCLHACLSVCLFVRLYVCPSVRPSVCLPVCQSVRLYVCPSVRLSIRLPVCQSVRLSACLSVRLSVPLFVCLSICLSVHLSVCLYTTFTSVWLPAWLSVRPSVRLSSWSYMLADSPCQVPNCIFVVCIVSVSCLINHHLITCSSVLPISWLSIEQLTPHIHHIFVPE